MKRYALFIAAVVVGCIAKAQEVIHFERIQSYLFVDGEVNGKTGKFMLDTGTGLPFLVNNHYVPVEHNDTLGMGTTGSGQSFATCISDDYSLIFGTEHYDKHKGTHNADLSFIEDSVCLHFLGFIGYGWLSHWKFAIDYKSSTLTLYPLGTSITVNSKKHKLMATIHFTPDEESPQLAYCDGEVAGEAMRIFFATGGSTGSLNLTPETKKRLEEKGAIKDVGNDEAHLNGLIVEGLKAPRLKWIDLWDSDKDEIGLSYEFLLHYISVWDYSTNTIELYKR